MNMAGRCSLCAYAALFRGCPNFKSQVEVSAAGSANAIALTPPPPHTITTHTAFVTGLQQLPVQRETVFVMQSHST